MSGTVAVPGGRFMAFFRFVMPNGVAFPFSCSEITATVTSPSGFKYEFHPDADELAFGPKHTSCEAVVLVPAGEPITLTARHANLLGHPALIAPPWDEKAQSPEIGWTNPTIFRVEDHAPSTHFRMVEMRQSGLRWQDTMSTILMDDCHALLPCIIVADILQGLCVSYRVTVTRPSFNGCPVSSISRTTRPQDAVPTSSASR